MLVLSQSTMFVQTYKVLYSMSNSPIFVKGHQLFSKKLLYVLLLLIIQLMMKSTILVRNWSDMFVQPLWSTVRGLTVLYLSWAIGALNRASYFSMLIDRTCYNDMQLAR